MRYSWQMLFDDFKKTYPRVWRKGTSYQPNGFMSLLITVPGLGKFTYEYFRKTLEMVEEFETSSERKTRLQNERNNLLTKFMEEVPKIMKENKISQRALSDMSGVSRQSINKYLSGKKIPKTTTMNQIYDALNSKN